MKNNMLVTDYQANINETVIPLETVGFVNIIENDLKSSPMSRLHEELKFIALKHNLDCVFHSKGFVGNNKHIVQAQDILIDYVKHN